MSGLLFAIALDLLQHLLEIHLEDSSLAWVRACAEDIGMPWRQLRHLSIVKVLFDGFEIFSGPDLKAIKCIIFNVFWFLLTFVLWFGSG